jgi:hypothetical protein
VNDDGRGAAAGAIDVAPAANLADGGGAADRVDGAGGARLAHRHPGLSGVGAAALVISVVSLVIARGARGAADEERVRFVATLGLVVCVTLTLGLVLAGLPTAILHGCGVTR